MNKSRKGKGRPGATAKELKMAAYIRKLEQEILRFNTEISLTLKEQEKAIGAVIDAVKLIRATDKFTVFRCSWKNEEVEEIFADLADAQHEYRGDTPAAENLDMQTTVTLLEVFDLEDAVWSNAALNKRDQMSNQLLAAAMIICKKKEAKNGEGL